MDTTTEQGATALVVQVPDLPFAHHGRAFPDDLAIASSEHYEDVAERVKTINLFIAQVASWFAPLKAQAHKLHRDICAKENATLAPAEADKAIVRCALVSCDDAQERIRKAEEARLAA